MAIQNVIGDSFRGATWVSIHNARRAGARYINGGFGMVLDGSKEAQDATINAFLMLTMVFQEEVGLVTKELYLQ
jgi:urocanate hydratase